MIKWFKKLFHIVKHFDDYTDAMEQLSAQQGRMLYEMRDAVKTIKDRTDVHGDIHMQPNGDMNQIIMIGRYRNHDYVEVFNVPPDDFELLMHKLRDARKYANLGRVDAAPGMKQVIEIESSEWR